MRNVSKGDRPLLAGAAVVAGAAVAGAAARGVPAGTMEAGPAAGVLYRNDSATGVLIA